jgi:hypothetical protein
VVADAGHFRRTGGDVIDGFTNGAGAAAGKADDNLLDGQFIIKNRRKPDILAFQ